MAAIRRHGAVEILTTGAGDLAETYRLWQVVRLLVNRFASRFTHKFTRHNFGKARELRSGFHMPAVPSRC